MPGHGLTGPLHNLSMSGSGLPRGPGIVKLDSGMRIPATTSFFDRGRALPLLRILNLPKVPLLEARAALPMPRKWMAKYCWESSSAT